MAITRGQRATTALPPDAPAWARQLQQELSRLFEAIQNGGLELSGVRLDVLREAVPSTGPDRGQPNLIAVNLAGTITLHIWDGATWVPL